MLDAGAELRPFKGSLVMSPQRQPRKMTGAGTVRLGLRCRAGWTSLSTIEQRSNRSGPMRSRTSSFRSRARERMLQCSEPTTIAWASSGSRSSMRKKALSLRSAPNSSRSTKPRRSGPSSSAIKTTFNAFSSTAIWGSPDPLRSPPRLAVTFNGNGDEFLLADPYVPNTLVYRLLLETAPKSRL